MELEIILMYCICYDTIKQEKIKENIQCKLTMAEVILIGLVAHKYFAGNIQVTNVFMFEHKYISYNLSKGRLNRRLHSLPKQILNKILKNLSREKGEFAVDSFPIQVCKNIRANRCKIYKSHKYKGFCASKDEFYVGVKPMVIASTEEEIVEFRLFPASVHDAKAIKQMKLSLPRGSRIYADKAFNDYKNEERVCNEKGIYLMPIRKSNSKRKNSSFIDHMIRKKRKIIETIFSQINALMPKSIHAVTAKGFELKIAFFITAFAFKNELLKVAT